MNALFMNCENEEKKPSIYLSDDVQMLCVLKYTVRYVLFKTQLYSTQSFRKKIITILILLFCIKVETDKKNNRILTQVPRKQIHSQDTFFYSWYLLAKEIIRIYGPLLINISGQEFFHHIFKI